MPIGDLFKLAKLTIEGYREAARQTPLGRPFEVQYNPETLSLRHESVFQNQQGPGTSGQGGWSHSRPERLSVTLVVDGTGVGHMGVLRSVPTVPDRIEQFLSTCYFVNGEIHEPAHLKLYWGKVVPRDDSFDCRLESVDVNYKSFDRDGSPLHAELAATFVKRLEPRKRAGEQNLSSPDVTHRRLVRAGDTLPLLCREIYGSSAHYLGVAQANQLDDFRNLIPGQELIFPPFQRPGKA